MEEYTMDSAQNAYKPVFDDDPDEYNIKPKMSQVGGKRGKSDDMEARMKMLQAERDTDIPLPPNRV